MARKIEWDSQIGRRLKLRDLHVFSTVVECGSMAKAAQHLGVSPPAVSEVIASLEHALGVPLLDRVAQGIEPTIYGGALLKRSVAAFDELKQGVRDIEFLSDATTGEVRIACTEALCYTLLPEIILRFAEQYPRVDVRVDLTGNVWDFPGLRERKYDCILHRSSSLQELTIDDLNVELLAADTAVIAAGVNCRWARRPKIDLVELTDDPWTFGAPDTTNGRVVQEMFRARGLKMPKPKVAAVSITLRARLVAGGPYLTMFASSVLRRLIADHFAVMALPVDEPQNRYSAIGTLKNRTLSPVVERFLACVREVAASFDGKQESQAVRSSKFEVS